MQTTANPTSSPSHVAAATAASADSSLIQRMRGDTCFNCRSQGHWARDCPLNSSPSSKSPPLSSSSPLPPVVQCPCGSGACVILTSRSSKNPNREYFACNGGKKGSCCKFYGWCDEVSAPVCPCRAGTCSINTDPVSKKKFFACRIKKGHGACGFFQWVDEYNASAKVRSAEAGNSSSPVNVPPQGILAQPTTVNGDPNSTFVDFLEASQLDGSVDLISNFKELVNRLSPDQNQSNCDQMAVDNQPSIPSSGSKDSEMELMEPIIGLDEEPVSLRPSSLADVHHRRKEFVKQLSAAGRDTVTGGISPSLDAVSTEQNLLPHVAVESAFNPGSLPQCTAPSVNIAPAEDHTIWNFPGVINGNDSLLAEKFVEKFKQLANEIKSELVKKLESSDQHDPTQLQRDATFSFASLDGLQVDSQQFKKHIDEYIQHTSSLAEIRTGESSLNMLLERYDKEKRQFEELSHIEAKTLNARAGCNGRIEFLRQEALRLKGTLLPVEKELSDCQQEFIGLNNKLGDIRHKAELAKASMEESSMEAAEASRALERMELHRSAMKAALEEAKQQIDR